VHGACGKTGVIVDNDYAGKRVLAVFQPIPNTKWALVIKQPVELFMQLFCALGSIYLVFLFPLFFALSILFKRNERRHMQETAAREFRFKELVESTDAWAWEVDANGVYSYSSIDKDITRMKEDRSAIEEMAYNDLLTHLSINPTSS